MYKDNIMKFRLGDVETGWMNNKTGVQQGCMMSPTLFNIYIEEMITRIRKAEIRATIENRKLGCLGYADDVVLLAESKKRHEQIAPHC